MPNESSAIVQRLWNYCIFLRDDGVSYGDYVEQLTYLLFLKMADEQTRPPYNRPSMLPVGFDWSSLLAKDGVDLEVHYRETLQRLGKEPGLLGVIFRKSQNRIQDPAKLKRLLSLIEDETWMGMDIDVKGAIYEGLLQKNAEDIKSGAGQYFTPRLLIQAMVEVMRPQPNMTFADPACGTGGFFLSAHDYISNHYQMDRDQKRFLKSGTFKGWEIVDSAARLCVMNLYLHGIGSDESPITVADSLLSMPSEHFDLVLTNPPFGKKSSITIVSSEGKADRETLTYEREDFWATTSNKQLNFLQHVKSLLKINGRAGVVVPDNVLFEGGAGETIRRKLLYECDVHTLLRLPTGIFYAQGVKANVLFFDRKPASQQPWTEKLWIYDLRTNINFTLKQNPLRLDDLQDFIACYNPENRHQRQETERFHAFQYADLVQRDKASLDIFWLRDESLEDSDNLPAPDVLALEIVENLQAADGPLSVAEITKQILDKGYWQSGGQTPEATISAALSKDVKKKGAASRFVWTDKATYGLNLDYKPLVQPELPVVNIPAAPEQPAPATMSFSDAAEHILQNYSNGKPMHYKAMTDKALELHIISTNGLTPAATMYAQILTEINRRKLRGEQARFTMLGAGFFGLSAWEPQGLPDQIEQHNMEMPPGDFEKLISLLLQVLGFDAVTVTNYSGDGGIDVRATLVVGEVIRTQMAVQVKRWRQKVNSPIVQQVRGSLGTHEQGLIITTSEFSKGAFELLNVPYN